MMQYVLLACRVVIGAVFLVSAGSKIGRRGAFAGFTASVRALVPPARGAAPALAGAVAAAEVVIAAAALWAPTQRWGLAAAALLLAVFSVALGLAVRRGVTTPCRCFGSASQPPGAPQLVRNAFLVGVCAVGLIGGPSDLAVRPGGAAVAVGAAAVLALLAIGADDLAVLFRTPSLGSH